MLITIEFLEKWNFEKLLPINVRSIKIQNQYKIFKQNLIKNNISIDKYISNKYIQSKKYSINKNNFPYSIPNNMEHYVLWINPLYFKKITNKELSKIINLKMKELNYNEYFCFENQKGCRSVLETPHYQVFYRKCE
uniref:Uncharacterized protein n=1 Tax=viral metagenome TaxID=1070528 RepID=A0A6C0LZ47_9ZZZZ